MRITCYNTTNNAGSHCLVTLCLLTSGNVMGLLSTFSVEDANTLKFHNTNDDKMLQESTGIVSILGPSLALTLFSVQCR